MFNIGAVELLVSLALVAVVVRLIAVGARRGTRPPGD